MARLTVSTVTYAFLYNFAVDQGAVGVINTGISIPAGSVVIRKTCLVLTTVLGGAGATIACGTATNPNSINAATAIATYVAGVFTPGAAVPPFIATGERVILTIAVAPLTAGKFVYFLDVQTAVIYQ